MMVEPGNVTIDLLKANGYVTTKSKQCANDFTKYVLGDSYIFGTNNTLGVSGPNRTTLRAYCVGNATSPDSSVKPPVACAVDFECDKDFKGGCCMTVDPGAVSADLMKANGYVTTKSKMCANDFTKQLFDQ